MNGLEALAVALAGLLTLFSAVGLYLLNRLKSLETSSEKRTAQEAALKEKELGTLRVRVTDLEEKAKRVPELERQLTTVLRELADVRERLTKAEHALNEAQTDNERLRSELTKTERDLDAARKLGEDLEIANRELRNVLGLFAAEYKETKRKETTEPKEGNETAQPAPMENVSNG